MQINLRKSLSGRKDPELNIIHSQYSYVVQEADKGYRAGGIQPDLAQDAAVAAEVCTVVKAVARERLESGGEGSHLELHFEVSPKHVDKIWGESLRDRRRV